MSAESRLAPPSSGATGKKYVYPIDPNGNDAPALLLRAVGSGKRVLEIGCASGVQSNAMREQGCRIVGIEIDTEAAEHAKRFCERVIVGNLETLDFDEVLGNDRFDIVTIADVLEHLRSPERVLSAAKRFLRPDGRIIASIPNVAHAGLILELAMGRFDYRPFGLLDDTHVRFFTLKSIATLFENCDLQINQLERAIRPLERTEFSPNRLLSAEEENILNFVRANNAEHETYQFVICAEPRPAAAVRRQEIVLREQIQDLRLKDAAQSKRIGRLESEMAWMGEHPLRTLVSAVLRRFSSSARV